MIGDRNVNPTVWFLIARRQNCNSWTQKGCFSLSQMIKFQIINNYKLVIQCDQEYSRDRIEIDIGQRQIKDRDNIRIWQRQDRDKI